MTVTIRAAAAADKQGCLDLLQALAATTAGQINPAAGRVFDQLLDGTRGQVFVATAHPAPGGALLGMASVSYNLAMRYGGEYCQLEELIVDPAARGQNVGALLMQTVVKQARERRCGEIGLYLLAQTEHNKAFYARFGFTALGTEMRQRLEYDTNA